MILSVIFNSASHHIIICARFWGYTVTIANMFVTLSSSTLYVACLNKVKLEVLFSNGITITILLMNLTAWKYLQSQVFILKKYIFCFFDCKVLSKFIKYVARFQRLNRNLPCGKCEIFIYVNKMIKSRFLGFFGQIGFFKISRGSFTLWTMMICLHTFVLNFTDFWMVKNITILISMRLTNRVLNLQYHNFRVWFGL